MGNNSFIFAGEIKMKRFISIFFLCLTICIMFIIGIFSTSQYHIEYLRIHIRANSNSQVDQDIKYQIKDEIVEFLTPIISSCKTKKDFQNKLNQNLSNIVGIANKILAQNNFDYKSSAKITNEYFPVRSYDNVTLENGYYDALIVNLGSGEGDNWWCVVYPPLCFLNSNADYVYKSRILEIIKQFFGG